jgi:hypothetical protein
MKAYLGDELVFDTSANSDKYVRPSDWIPLPDVVDGEDKFVGLFHVRDDGVMDRIAIRFASDYTVDWGDGTVESYGSSHTEEHQYDFSALPNENLTKEGYKQVVVTVVPQEGKRFTSIDLSYRLQNGAKNNSFSEIKISADVLTTFSSATRGQFLLKNFEFMGSSLDSTRYAFYESVQLERVKINDVSKITDAFDSFGRTYNLKEIDFSELTLLINASKMFTESNIEEISISLPAAEDLSYFLYDNHCTKKITLEKLNQNGVSMSYGFSSVKSLEEIVYDGVINLTGNNYSMCSNSYNLRKVPTFNLENSINNTKLFYGNKNLTEVELLNIKENISLQYNRFGRDTLVNIFNNLVDMGEERTIDITGCFGAGELTDADVAIATNKNWTVIK